MRLVEYCCASGVEMKIDEKTDDHSLSRCSCSMTLSSIRRPGVCIQKRGTEVVE